MKALIITEFIAPVHAVASIRWTKLGKYLSKDLGYSVDILTNRKSFQPSSITLPSYKQDQTLVEDLQFFENIYEAPDSLLTKCVNSLFNLLKKSKHHRSSSSTTEATAASLTTPKQNKDGSLLRSLWDIYMVLKDHGRPRKMSNMNIDWGDYDVIISSYGPKWVHLAAERIKHANPSLIWIADYRDPLVFSEHTDTKANRLFPAHHTNDATLITFISPFFEDLMLPEEQARLFLPNGYDDEATTQQNRAATDRFYISITGSLYDDGTNASDLRPLFNILSNLILEGQIDAKDIEVRHCGNRSDIFLAQAAEFPQVPTLECGLISRASALEMQSSSSLLVLPVWNTQLSKGVISGRIYEYFASNTPIIGLCSGDLEGSSLKEMIEKSRTGFCYEEACRLRDADLLRQFVLEKYQEWRRSGMTNRDTDWAYVKSYSYSSLAKKLDKAITQLMKGTIYA